jgi:hypothetical protein
MKRFELYVLCATVAALMGFCCEFGYRTVSAQPPPACPKHDCKSIHTWWANGALPGTQCYGAMQPFPIFPILQAHKFIYSPFSNEKLPWNAAGSYDRYKYPNHTKHCGLDANGQFQSIQEVSPIGDPVPDGTSWNRYLCTPKADPDPL